MAGALAAVGSAGAAEAGTAAAAGATAAEIAAANAGAAGIGAATQGLASAGAGGALGQAAGGTFFSGLLDNFASGYQEPFAVPNSIGQAAGQLMGFKDKGISGSLSSQFLKPVIDKYKQQRQDVAFQQGPQGLLGEYTNPNPLGNLIEGSVLDPFNGGGLTSPNFSAFDKLNTPNAPGPKKFGILSSGIGSGLLSGGGV